MQVMDIHSHTRYSNCGIDEPEVIAQAALAGVMDAEKMKGRELCFT